MPIDNQQMATDTLSAARLRARWLVVVAVLAALTLTAIAPAASAAPPGGVLRGVVIPGAKPPPIAAAPAATSAARAASNSGLTPSLAIFRREVGIVSGILVRARNAIVPRFKLDLLWHGDYPVLDIKGFELSPVTRAEAESYACIRCTGQGHFLPAKLHGRKLVANVRGTRLMNSKTAFLADVTEPGHIGRIQGSKLKITATSLGTQTFGNACLGADTGTDLTKFGGTLPFVPCTTRTPRDPGVALAFPAELSSSQRETGAIVGRTSGPRWLSVFQVHGPCLADAQLDAQAYGRQVMYHVNGKFAKRFTTGIATKPGLFCAYLQTGGRYRKVPDGQLTLVGEVPFYAGDFIQISVPGTVAAGQVIATTYQGFASSSFELYTFHSYEPCAADAQDEAPQAFGYFFMAVGPGGFSVPVTSLPVEATTFACAYLQTAGPAGVTPQGVTVASNEAEVAVTPAAPVTGDSRRIEPRRNAYQEIRIGRG